MVCTFYKESSKISAFDIHEWVNKYRRMDENEITTIQIDGPKRQVFITWSKNIVSGGKGLFLTHFWMLNMFPKFLYHPHFSLQFK